MGTTKSFSWVTNLTKGAIPGVWGVALALFIQKGIEFVQTGTLVFSVEEQQWIIAAIAAGCMWVYGQVKNLLKNHPKLTSVGSVLSKFLTVVICVSLAGCATFLPTKTVTSADGVVTTTVDVDAVKALTDEAIAAAKEASALIEEYNAAKTETEQAEADAKLERQTQRLSIVADILQSVTAAGTYYQGG